MSATNLLQTIVLSGLVLGLTAACEKSPSKQQSRSLYVGSFHGIWQMRSMSCGSKTLATHQDIHRMMVITKDTVMIESGLVSGDFRETNFRVLYEIQDLVDLTPPRTPTEKSEPSVYKALLKNKTIDLWTESDLPELGKLNFIERDYATDDNFMFRFEPVANTLFYDMVTELEDQNNLCPGGDKIVIRYSLDPATAERLLKEHSPKSNSQPQSQLEPAASSN